MQNRWHSTDEAGYVALNGGWRCARCGCWNTCGDVCRQCGWNRCGCQGGVVAAQTRKTSCDAAETTRDASERRDAARCTTGCGKAATARQRDCDDCPADCTAGHRVQCCPANTSTRSTTCGCSRSACGCEAATTETRCGCGCETATTESRCGCGCEEATTESRCGCEAATTETRCGCGDTSGVGMVYAAKHKLGDVYQSESALRTGTLFPELHKPLNGRCPRDGNCSTPCQQSAFAAWDLRLYLDTHPDDAQAMAFFAQLAQEADDPNYATAFLDGCAPWTWTDDPWPWECQPCNAK